MKWGPKQSKRAKWSKRDLAGVAADLQALANEHARRAQLARKWSRYWRALALAAVALAVGEGAALAWALKLAAR